MSRDDLPARIFPSFDALKDASGFALGVSGGSDSIALFHIFSAWRAASSDNRPAFVFAVDHGMRSEAADECRDVMALATRLGLQSQTLTLSKKPKNMSEARDARYAALISAMRSHGLSHLLLGHQADDQAETQLYRWVSGTGIDGLGAMRPMSERDGITLVRPLLAERRKDLRRHLVELGVDWNDDPTNADTDHVRTRMRRTLAGLEKDGFDPRRAAAFARRAQRASDALNSAVDGIVNDHVHVALWGDVSITRETFLDLPEELQIRLLARLLHIARGHNPRHLEKLESALDALLQGSDGTTTVAGCDVRFIDQTLRVAREARHLPDPIIASAVASTRWDARYAITFHGMSSGAPGENWMVAPGQALGLDRHAILKDLPEHARNTVPVLFDGKKDVVFSPFDVEQSIFNAEFVPASVESFNLVRESSAAWRPLSVGKIE